MNTRNVTQLSEKGNERLLAKVIQQPYQSGNPEKKLRISLDITVCQRCLYKHVKAEIIDKKDIEKYMLCTWYLNTDAKINGFTHL